MFKTVYPTHEVSAYTAAMVDLRTLSMDERRALAAEAEDRARAGEAPGEIRKALGLSYKTYNRWAKLYGFRQGDLCPDTPRTGAKPSLPPGPGGYAKSGRYLHELGLPEDHPVRTTGPGHPGWRGGEAAFRDRYAARRDQAHNETAKLVSQLSPRDLLTRIEQALDNGCASEADRLLRAWRALERRETGLNALRALAEEEEALTARMPEGWRPIPGLSHEEQIEAMDDDTLRAYIRSLIPKPIPESYR